MELNRNEKIGVKQDGENRKRKGMSQCEGCQAQAIQNQQFNEWSDV